MANTRVLFTTEQKEAWNKAKKLLNQYRGSSEYRYLHIAMSELRAENGRTHKGPIEAEPKNPDKQVHRLAKIRSNAIPERVKEWKEYLRDPGSKKLYIIVRDDLSPSQKAVQASHATAEFQKRLPNAPWINGTMILMESDSKSEHYKSYAGSRWGLKSEDKDQFEEFCKSIYRPDYQVIWREPDQANRVTAIALLSNYMNDSIGRLRGIKLL
jgi:hypothetical protein